MAIYKRTRLSSLEELMQFLKLRGWLNLPPGTVLALLQRSGEPKGIQVVNFADNEEAICWVKEDELRFFEMQGKVPYVGGQMTIVPNEAPTDCWGD